MAEPAVTETRHTETRRGRKYQSRYLKYSEIGTPESQADDLDPAVFTTDPKQIEIWERRIINPNPALIQVITLKERGWLTRWINTRAYPGRLQLAREQGYLPVKKDELADPSEIIDLQVSPEGYVVRGDRGEEILMKIPEAVYQKAQRRKVEIRQESYKGSTFREGLQNRVASVYGDAAADAVGMLRGTIKFGTERVRVDENFEEI